MGAFSWYKIHHGAPTDPKWLMLADRAQSSPALVWATFSAAVDHASAHDDRGSLKGFDIEIVASFFRASLDEVQRVFQALIDKGLVVADRLKSWAKRQGIVAAEAAAEGVSRAAIRMRRMRERERIGGEQMTFDLGVTGGVTGVTRASQQASQAPRKREREIKTKEADASFDCAREGAISDESTRQTKRASGIAVDWWPDAADCQYASSQGRDDRWIGDEADAFADHHRARGTRFLDWRAAWRTWVRNAGKFESNRRGGGGFGGHVAAGSGEVTSALYAFRARRGLV